VEAWESNMKYLVELHEGKRSLPASANLRDAGYVSHGLHPDEMEKEETAEARDFTDPTAPPVPLWYDKDKRHWWPL